MSSTPRWSYNGLVLGVAAALTVWVLHQVGWLAAWDGHLYDQALSLTAPWRNPTPKVLLLRLEREDAWSDAEAVKALELLEQLGAKAVAINFLPFKSSRDFFQKAAASRKVIFGRELRPAADNPDTLKLDPWPEAAAGLELAWGVAYLPPSLKGVYRWQQTRVAAGDGVYPTLEARTATLCNSDQPTPDGAFLVNFIGGPGKLPNVSLSRLLAGELIPEMVKGKAVLIGGHDGLLGLETPLCGGEDTMSFLEFQGNALQTLLDRSPIIPLPWALSLLLLTGLGMGTSLVYQRAHSVAGVRWALVILLACATAAVAGLWFLRTWSPLGAVILAQSGQYGLTLLFRTRMANRALNEMRLRSLNQIKERFCPESLEQSAEYWDHLVSMITQMLDVERMVFLNRVPKTQRLEGIKAVNCRFEDLREKERTLDAPVFSMALAKGSPVRISGFLPESAVTEEEYLCPLVYAGEVLGMWVVGVDPARCADIPQLESVLSRFSQKIARVLYQKRRAAPKRSLAARVQEWFSAEKEDQGYRELRRTADILEQHYDMLEAVLSQVSTAMIAYDFFGRVLKANEPALTLLQAENFVPSRATALDFLRLVTRMDESELRNLLRNVLLERSPVSISIRLASQQDRQYLLRVFPLTDAKQRVADQESSSVRGLVCEIIETTLLSTLASLKGVVADRLGVELRDHLAAIEISATLLEMDRFTPAERKSVLEAIHQKTSAAVQVITECQKYLGRGVDAYAISCFPLDVLELLERACSAISQKATARHITLAIEQPRLMDQVMATTTELAQFFSSALDLLLRDAAENTAVSIQVEDASVTSILRLSNCGFGIPNERLQAILTSEEVPGAEEFQVLREALVWVRNWGGKLEITSDVGKGYSITLELRQFKLATLAPMSAGA